MSYSLSFPNIFNKSTVNLESGYDSIRQNIVLLLASNKGGLYGDPWFGTDVKRILWDPNHRDIMKNLVQDQIYESIYSYMPNNIDIKKDDIEIRMLDNYANVKINLSAYSNVDNDMLDIDLLNENDVG